MQKYKIIYHLSSGKVFEREIEASSLNMAKVTAIVEPTYFGDGEKYEVSLNSAFIAAREIVLVEE